MGYNAHFVPVSLCGFGWEQTESSLHPEGFYPDFLNHSVSVPKHRELPCCVLYA